MNVHDRTLELAAAGLDFGLSAAERRALNEHLHGCSRCRGDVAGLDDDARRIAARPLQTLAPARAAVLREGVLHSGHGWRPALLLVAAGLLLLLGLAVATGGGMVDRVDRLLRGQEAPLAIPLPAVVTADGWTATMLTTEEGEPPVVGIPYGGGAAGRIAIGQSCTAWEKPPGDCTLEIRWSSDGLSWPASGTQIDISPPSGASTEGWLPTVTDVAAADDGFVATAYSMTDGIDGASAWWSPDGRRWESHSLGQGSRAATVISTTDGWMIGGSLERGDQQLAAIWTSPDGRTWTLTSDDPVFAVGELDRSLDGRMLPGVQDMATIDGLVVATGIACSPTLGACTGAAWVSEDGRNWSREDPDTGTDLPHFTTALEGRIITMAYTDSGLTRVYGFDPAGGWTLLKGDLGFVQEAVPVDGGVAVATGDGSGVSDVMTIRFSRDGRTWSDIATVDPPDVSALMALSLSDAAYGGIRADWFGAGTPEAHRSAVWVFSRAPLPSSAP
ncbi:MAG: hypothetical protein QG587_2021 [Chloroflexota bacterium]|nr:hypothetical protein [Chloroflexota bacterium]